MTLRHRLQARPSYPFTLDYAVGYDLGEDGLTVTVTVTNAGSAAAPVASGAHPYLTAGTAPIDGCELCVPAEEILTADDRMIPDGRRPVAGTDHDFRQPRPLGDVVLDTAYTALGRSADGRATVSLAAPSGRVTELWVDEHHPYLMVFTGDTLAPADRRRGLAVEPMTAPPNALVTGEGLVVLAARREPPRRLGHPGRHAGRRVMAAAHDERAGPAGGGTSLLTYVLIDGENLDATLGSSVLGRRPAPDERPRWERVVQFAERVWGAPVRTLFFINASSGNLPMPFVQALLALGHPAPAAVGPARHEGRRRGHPAHVGGDRRAPGQRAPRQPRRRLRAQIEALLGDDRLGNERPGDERPGDDRLGAERAVGVLAFRELLSNRYRELVGRGLQIFDLEDDAGCFNLVLPRVRVIEIDRFDPTPFLD